MNYFCHRRQALLFLLMILSAHTSVYGDIDPAREDKMRYAAEVRWNTDEPATSQVEYGEELGQYSFLTPLDKNLVTDHRMILTGLKPSTLYHYRVKSVNQVGEETVSEDYTISIVSPGNKPKMRIAGVETRNIIATGYLPQEPEKTETEKEGKPEDPNTSAPSKTPVIMNEAPIQETLIQENALLLPPGKFQFEPSLTYAHASANKMTVRGFAILPILVIGEVSTEEVKRDIFIPSVTLRAGLWKNLQGEFIVPYRFQYNRVSNQFNEPDEKTADNGIGDIEGSLYYQFMHEKGAIPGVIGGITVKSDTGRSPYGALTGLGTGHWAIKGSATAVKSADPAILFAGINYAWSIKKDIDGFGNVDPGDTISYSIGMAIALNYQTAINFQLEQDISTSVVMNGDEVPNSFTNNAVFKTGLIYSVSKNLSIDVTSGIGLTEDSPDFTIEVRVPYSF